MTSIIYQDEAIYNKLKLFMIKSCNNVIKFKKPKPNELVSFIVNKVEKETSMLYHKELNDKYLDKLITYYIGANFFEDFKVISVSSNLSNYYSNLENEIDSSFSYNGLLIIKELFLIKNKEYKSILYNILTHRHYSNLKTLFVSDNLGTKYSHPSDNIEYFNFDTLKSIGYKDMTNITASCRSRIKKSPEELLKELKTFNEQK